MDSGEPLRLSSAHSGVFGSEFKDVFTQLLDRRLELLDPDAIDAFEQTPFRDALQPPRLLGRLAL